MAVRNVPRLCLARLVGGRLGLKEGGLPSATVATCGDALQPTDDVSTVDRRVAVNKSPIGTTRPCQMRECTPPDRHTHWAVSPVICAPSVVISAENTGTLHQRAVSPCRGELLISNGCHQPSVFTVYRRPRPAAGLRQLRTPRRGRVPLGGIQPICFNICHMGMPSDDDHVMPSRRLISDISGPSSGAHRCRHSLKPVRPVPAACSSKVVKQ